MFVEALEDRRLFSLSPVGPVHQSATEMHIVPAMHSVTKLVQSAHRFASYSGIYVLGDGSGGEC